MNKVKLISQLAPRERGNVVQQSWAVQVGWTKEKKNPKNSNYKSEYMQTERSMQVMNANSLNVHTSARTLYTFKPVCLNFTGQEMTHLFKD